MLVYICCECGPDFDLEEKVASDFLEEAVKVVDPVPVGVWTPTLVVCNSCGKVIDVYVEI